MTYYGAGANRRNKKGCPEEGSLFVESGKDYLPLLMAACAAARRAMGTRNGEQDT